VKRLFGAALAAVSSLFALAAAAPARAQDFPARQIAMIVVFAPGGATDVLARLAADHMGRTLPRPAGARRADGRGAGDPR
jgi:tripartite-type tricarboxylate transporter receptor subunit TctC